MPGVRLARSRAVHPLIPPAQVWYTVPARATAALEEAVRDALPHLVEANPRLLYQLVTALSPAELKVGRAACKRVWMGVCMS
jgi:hypothetical protein